MRKVDYLLMLNNSSPLQLINLIINNIEIMLHLDFPAEFPVNPLPSSPPNPPWGFPRNMDRSRPANVRNSSKLLDKDDILSIIKSVRKAGFPAYKSPSLALDPKW